MSPSESELRSALRNGEGDGPDPDTVLATARTAASARRTRIAAVSGAAAAVLLIGAGALTLGHRTDHPTADGAGRTATSPAVPPAASTAKPRAARLCPTSFPSAPLPGGGGSGRFGSGGALFPKPVDSVVVCGYGSTGETEPPGLLTLTGARAQALVSSLEGAATTRPHVMCPDYRNAADHRYAFVGLTSEGAALQAVTTTVGGGPSCSVRVTNGTALRYNWSVPVALAPALGAVHPG